MDLQQFSFFLDVAFTVITSRHLNLSKPPAEVGVDVREAVVLSQREQDASRAAALTLAAEAAVANATTWRALPILRREPNR